MLLKIISIFAVISWAECSRILVVYPTISKSHILPLQTLSIALAKKGHDITFVSTYPLDKKIENFRDVRVKFDDNDKEFLSEIAKDPKGKGFFYMFPKLTSLIYRLGNETLQSEDVRRLMSEEKFDVVIVGYFMTEFMLGLADHFKCPSILFSPAGTMTVINQALGSPLGTSGTPHLMLPLPKMDFIGRLKTFLVTGVELILTQYLKHRGKQVYDFNFPAESYRSYDDSLRNVSLALVNSHFSGGIVRPYVPNLIEVGGLQVKQKPDPLPEKLKTFLDEAKDGAVFFSLGSNAKSTFLSQETIKIILNVFAELKHLRFIMKWESDTMEGQPENVFIGKWLPQDDILAHSNLKLFISHCGLGGIVEAKYHGVPILGFPLFGDQPGNAANIEKEGWSIVVNLGSLTEVIFKKSIVEMIKNPKYTEIVKKKSDLARDRPMNPQDTAVFWVEYILRHNGAPHMHYMGADLNFWQFNSVDVVVFLAALGYLVLKGTAMIIRKVCCGAKGPSTKNKKKLN